MCSISRLHVVSALWLLACCTEGERVGEQRFSCLDLSCPGEGGGGGWGSEGRPEGGKRKRRLEGEGERGDGGRKRPRVAGEREGEPDDEETRLDEEALLLQYQNGEKERDSQRERAVILDSVIGSRFSLSVYTYVYRSQQPSFLRPMREEGESRSPSVRRRGREMASCED